MSALLEGKYVGSDVKQKNKGKSKVSRESGGSHTTAKCVNNPRNKRTLRVLDTVARSLSVLVNGLAMQHLQCTIKKSMNLLQSAGLVRVRGAHLSNVARATLHRIILDGRVTDLKDLDWQRVLFVLLQGLQHPGQERSTNDLVLSRLGVSKADSNVTGILLAQESKVLVM